MSKSFNERWWESSSSPFVVDFFCAHLISFNLNAFLYYYFFKRLHDCLFAQSFRENYFYIKLNCFLRCNWWWWVEDLNGFSCKRTFFELSLMNFFSCFLLNIFLYFDEILFVECCKQSFRWQQFSSKITKPFFIF